MDRTRGSFAAFTLVVLCGCELIVMYHAYISGSFSGQDTVPVESQNDSVDEGKSDESPLYSRPSGEVTKSELLQLDLRRQVAEDLLVLRRQLSLPSGWTDGERLKVAHQLGRIALRLDPRTLSPSPKVQDTANKTESQLEDLSEEGSGRVKADPLRSDVDSHDTTKLHVCPEVLRYNAFLAFEVEPCSHVPPFHEVMTVILVAHSWSSRRITRLVEQMRRWYNLPLVVSIDTEDQKLSLKTLGTQSVKYVLRGKMHDGDLFNVMAKLVQTPFALLALGLSGWTEDVLLERVARVFDSADNVGVVGGSFRDPDGHWSNGCLQCIWSNYYLTYTMGYHHSRHECMYCDDVMSPFVFRTEVLHQHPFTRTLSGPGLLRDWFLQLQNASWLVMSCPDVMFYADGPRELARHDWQGVASIWMVQDIYTHTGSHVHFDCIEIDLDCKYPLDIITQFMLPPCCTGLAESFIGDVDHFAQSRNLSFELRYGTLMGALKMSNYLPWDMDIDLAVLEKDRTDWMKLEDYWRGKCVMLDRLSDEFFSFNCNYFSVDFIFEKSFSSMEEQASAISDQPTRMLYSGKWITVPRNPASNIREYYGWEYLQHAVHWRHQGSGATDGFIDFKKVGSWPPCQDPSDHTCLSHFPVDGNLGFLPEIHLTPLFRLNTLGDPSQSQSPISSTS